MPRLVIGPDGNLKYIYDDSSPFNGLGDLTVERASHVEFNNDDKLWYVYDPETHKPMLDAGFKSRSVALEAEKVFLDSTMTK